MITHIPFMPRIRINGESVASELLEKIQEHADKYSKDEHSFSAKFELLPDPEGRGHFLVSEVTYLRGDLIKEK